MFIREPDNIEELYAKFKEMIKKGEEKHRIIYWLNGEVQRIYRRGYKGVLTGYMLYNLLEEKYKWLG